VIDVTPAPFCLVGVRVDSFAEALARLRVAREEPAEVNAVVAWTVSQRTLTVRVINASGRTHPRS